MNRPDPNPQVLRRGAAIVLAIIAGLIVILALSTLDAWMLNGFGVQP